MLTVVIGDIHGMAAKLERLLDLVNSWIIATHAGQPHRFVFLGDYIDRGPHSKEVIARVQTLQEVGAICLRGNHEALMVNATESELGLRNFLANGGNATIASLGTAAAFRRAQAWMRDLPSSFEDPLRYFVHAGVRPGVPLASQNDDTKLWIREEFLQFKGAFPKYVVHGHTPTNRSNPQQTTPDIRSNRCNVDTGAVRSGPYLR